MKNPLLTLFYLALFSLMITCTTKPRKSFFNSTTKEEIPNSSGVVLKKQGQRTFIVTIKQMRFIPDTIAVLSGDSILWKNEDLVAHCATEANRTWTSGSIPPGSSWKKVNLQSANYYCAIHPTMKGSIKVIAEK